MNECLRVMIKRRRSLPSQGSDSGAEAPGEHQPVTVHLSPHQQSSGPLHHPRLWEKARLPAQVGAEPCDLVVRFLQETLSITHPQQIVKFTFD